MLFPQAPSLEPMLLTSEHASVALPVSESLSHHVVICCSDAVPPGTSLGSIPLTCEHTDISPMQECMNDHVVAVAAVPVMVLLAAATVLLLLQPF